MRGHVHGHIYDCGAGYYKWMQGSDSKKDRCYDEPKSRVGIKDSPASDSCETGMPQPNSKLLAERANPFVENRCKFQTECFSQEGALPRPLGKHDPGLSILNFWHRVSKPRTLQVAMFRDPALQEEFLKRC